MLCLLFERNDATIQIYDVIKHSWTAVFVFHFEFGLPKPFTKTITYSRIPYLVPCCFVSVQTVRFRKTSCTWFPSFKFPDVSLVADEQKQFPHGNLFSRQITTVLPFDSRLMASQLKLVDKP